MENTELETVTFIVNFNDRIRAKNIGLMWDIELKEWYKDFVVTTDLLELSKWFMIDKITSDTLSLHDKALIKADNIRIYNQIQNVRIRLQKIKYKTN
jgi:hypothetical protein